MTAWQKESKACLCRAGPGSGRRDKTGSRVRTDCPDVTLSGKASAAREGNELHDRKRSRKKSSVPLCHRETAYRSEREHTIDLVSQKFAKIAKSGDTNHSGKRVLRHNGLR